MWEFFVKLWRAILDLIHWLLMQLGWIAKPQETPKIHTLEAFNTLTSHFADLYLDTSKLSDDHPFWTAQGRMEALDNIIDALISSSLVLNGRLGKNIAQICVELPHFTPEKVLGLVKNHFAVFKNEYPSSKNPERKAEVVNALIELYEPLRNYQYFKEFIVKKETFQLQWILNKTSLSPLPSELKNYVIDYLIPSPQP
jgi:hypothetical protein